MPPDGAATVTPNQPWTQDGTAFVAPEPPFQDLKPRTMPLDNRSPDEFTVDRSQYPLGLVLVPTGHEPTTIPAVLPILASSGTSYRVTGDKWVDFPDGFVVWFLVR